MNNALTVRNCKILGNWGSMGGGLQVPPFNSLVVEDSDVLENHAEEGVRRVRPTLVLPPVFGARPRRREPVES